ncbi:uncharacterized protein LOC127700288 isoform X2 [Mytilus californianus]|uniref:uncharacterized protein LOC127700288 isoform X2 n=1 Tax=Mytilus californianus TaxID=6549 RepID=UPI002246C68A|nr:uncharacterized protein LOC127700288 isoform X2 [Mytilus californianus]
MMKMVYKPFCLMVALIISKTASQNLTVTSACIEPGTTLQLTCKTTDFASAVLFYLNGINKGGCTTISCGTSISGYTTPTQSGTSTEMTISNYNHSRDGGDWTCSYGVSTSSPYTVELGNCNSSPGDSLGGSAIAGIVVAIVFLGVLVIILIVMLWRHKKTAKKEATCSHSINLFDNSNVDLSKVMTVEWIHELFRNEDLKSKSGQPSIIPCVSMEHSGKWTCTIQFKESRQSKTISLYLTVNALSMKAASAYPVNLLEKLQFIRNSDSVKWTHNSNPFVCDQDMYKNGNVNNPSLNIICVSLEDSGKWQCKMEFGGPGPQQTKTFEVHLQVNGKPMEATVSSKVELLPELLEINDIKIVDWQHNNVKVGTRLPPYTIESVSLGDYGNWLGTLHFRNKEKSVKKFSVELKVLAK